MIDLTPIKKIYFIGIGGIAMSATAGLAKHKGFEVSGSDSDTIYPPSIDVLEKYGIDFHVGYDAERLSKTPQDLFIISAGETHANPEVAFVVNNDLPHIPFAELLYELSKEDLRIVVAGTHGKSTTSSMLGEALKGIDDSSYMVGAVLKDTESNFYEGSGHYFVFEGDEYRAGLDEPAPKFHFYKPDILVLTNLEYDHPDVYESLETMQEEFFHLVENLPEDAIIIYNSDDARLEQVLYKTNRRAFSYSAEAKSTVKLESFQTLPDRTEFTVVNSINPESIRPETYQITLPGKINVLNAMAVITTLRALGFHQELVSEKIKAFNGIKRRFEILENNAGVTIIDDYAHHPTAVKETLEAARLKYPDAKIWAVFEPHTYSRTEALIDQLASCFASADEVVLAPIYAAREKGVNFSITDDMVATKVGAQHKRLHLVKNKTQALTLLLERVQPGEVVIVMAVGSFNHLSYELRDALGKV